MSKAFIYRVTFPPSTNILLKIKYSAVDSDAVWEEVENY